MKELKEKKQWTHSELCDFAVKWLKRPMSNNGFGCQVALSEVQSGFDGETPDAIGWRQNGSKPGSCVVEAKKSRADFLSDKKKPHRNGEVLGLGKWRFYICPEGLIKPEELPEKWGLLYVNSRGWTRVVVGIDRNTDYADRKEYLNSYQHCHDQQRESFILVKMLNRLGDIEAYNQKIKEVTRLNQRLVKSNRELKELVGDSKSHYLRLERKYNKLQEQMME